MGKFDYEIKIIEESGLFDRAWYLAEYPDVAAVGMDPIEHYLRVGARLGRNPGPGFDTRFYLERNRDLVKAGMNPLVHYLWHGKEVGWATIRYLNGEGKKLLSSGKAIWPHEGCEDIIISVIIPIYDRTDTLRSAIESILQQSCKCFELILVLDGSPKETKSIANEYLTNDKVRIFEYQRPSGNAVRARNKGIKEARGRYIAFLDSDDEAYPDRLKLSLHLLDSGGADVVYGAWCACMDGTRQIEGLEDGQVVFSPECDLELLSESCVPCQSTVTVRKSVLDITGYLKPKMEYREDHELWARLAYFGAKFRSIREPLSKLRIHEGNNELNFKDEDKKWEQIFTAEFKKRGPIPKKIAFIIPGFGISGGMSVILRHANYLLSQGDDVLLINVGETTASSDWWSENSVPIYSVRDQREYLFPNIDILIATFWTTAAWFNKFDSNRRIYFVQSDERLFYDDASIKKKVAETYQMTCEYVVVSSWIADMLASEFHRSSKIALNGVSSDIFFPDKPILKKPKNRLRILLEGPLDLPMKGMMDAYAAVSNLDCEIWIVSSSGRPRANWRCDKFFASVPVEEMRRVYSSCDILVKMSRVESFCLPALEAMACGCAVVIARPEGGIEFLKHEENALVVKRKDIEAAHTAVKRLIDDSSLRIKLIQGGFQTAESYTAEVSVAQFQRIVENKNTR